jgi:hypothetical protein
MPTEAEPTGLAPMNVTIYRPMIRPLKRSGVRFCTAAVAEVNAIAKPTPATESAISAEGAVGIVATAARPAAKITSPTPVARSALAST